MFVRFVDTDVFTNVMSGPVERAVLSADLRRFVYTYAARNFKHTCQFSWVPHINNHFDTIRQTAGVNYSNCSFLFKQELNITTLPPYPLIVIYNKLSDKLIAHINVVTGISVRINKYFGYKTMD